MHEQNFLSKLISLFPKINGQLIRQEFRHAFSTETAQEHTTLSEKERVLITKLVTIIRKRNLALPAAMFLECAQPLNYIGSQMMVFFRPFLTFFFSPAEYDVLQNILEKREGIKSIIEELEKSPLTGKKT
jgi:hypothetical protein